MIDKEDFIRTVYVGNLPQEVTEQILFAFFNTFGEIKSVTIPIDHVTEKKRGFAFIEFDEKEEALSAIDNYDQTDFMDRTIRVRKSKPQDLKPNYHGPIWHNDDWLQQIERKKIENEQLTQALEKQNRELGLPIFKNVEKKEDEKPINFVEEDD